MEDDAGGGLLNARIARTLPTGTYTIEAATRRPVWGLAAGSWLRSIWVACQGGFSDNPTLLLWGLKDIAFRRKELGRWLAELSNPETHTLDDAGHFVVEEALEWAAPLLRDFVKRLRISRLELARASCFADRATGGYRLTSRMNVRNTVHLGRSHRFRERTKNPHSLFRPSRPLPPGLPAPRSGRKWKQPTAPLSRLRLCTCFHHWPKSSSVPVVSSRNSGERTYSRRNSAGNSTSPGKSKKSAPYPASTSSTPALLR